MAANALQEAGQIAAFAACTGSDYVREMEFADHCRAEAVRREHGGLD